MKLENENLKQEITGLKKAEIDKSIVKQLLDSMVEEVDSISARKSEIEELPITDTKKHISTDNNAVMLSWKLEI